MRLPSAGFSVLLALHQAQVLPAQNLDGNAQATGPREPAWVTTWSPLAPIADLPRTLPGAPPLPDLLRLPPPPVGLFWTVGVAAGLPTEIGSSQGDLRASITSERGAFRRPLDADDVVARQLLATRWQRAGEHAAVAGRVTLDDQTLGNSSYSDVTAPYGSDPIVNADTSQPRMRRLRARLEGAIGWEFPPWSLGLGAGFEVREGWSQESRFPRLMRAAVPGASFSVAHLLPWADIRLAAYLRRQGGDEIVSLTPQPGVGLVYLLHGYAEPDPRVVNQLPPYLRRIQGDARVSGLAAEGVWLGTRWTAFTEWTRRLNTQSSQRSNDPPKDRWSASGWTAGGAVQRRFLNQALIVTAAGRYSRLRGDATRLDLEGVAFRARESVLSSWLDVWYAPGDLPWSVTAALGVSRESRLREDFVDAIASDIVAWTPGLAVEVARSIAPSTAVAVGAGLSQYAAVSSIPNPSFRGRVYQLLLAPELALYGTSSTAQTASFTVRHRLNPGAALWMRARVESARPGEAVTASGSNIPFGPEGERTLASLSFGVILN